MCNYYGGYINFTQFEIFSIYNIFNVLSPIKGIKYSKWKYHWNVGHCIVLINITWLITTKIILASGLDVIKNTLKYLLGNKKSALLVTSGSCVSNSALFTHYQLIFLKAERLQWEEISDYIVSAYVAQTSGSWFLEIHQHKYNIIDICRHNTELTTYLP